MKRRKPQHLTIIVGPAQLYEQLAGGRTRTTFRRWLRRSVAAGYFPAPIRLSPRVSVWRRDDIDHWLASK